MRIKLAALIFLFITVLTFGQTKFQKDFSYYWQTVNDNFAYFGEQKTNWEKVKTNLSAYC